VLAELGILFADSRYPLADRAGHTGSSALGGGCGPPIATTEADRARELSDQEVALGVGLRFPHGVLDGARLVDVVFDLGEAAAVGVLARSSSISPASPSAICCPVSAATRSSTWNSRPARSSRTAWSSLPPARRASARTIRASAAS
jgi:hypothetical protein